MSTCYNCNTRTCNADGKKFNCRYNPLILRNSCLCISSDDLLCFNRITVQIEEREERTQFTKAIAVDNRCCDCFCDSGGTKILGKFDSVTLGQIIICRQHKLSVFWRSINIIKPEGGALC